MFEKVGDAEFVTGEHQVLRFWSKERIFDRLRRKNAGNPAWSFLDGPITANNPMGVHHAWGRTYKDTFQRYWAMNDRELRYQNGFDCQGLWVEVEVEKQLGLGAKSAIEEYGVDKFVWECKKRVLKYAAVQTEQSIRLGYWMEWDDPASLLRLADAIGTDKKVAFTPPKKRDEAPITDLAERIVERLGNPDWGGSYFTFSTENNETIWTFLKKCFERGKVYRGHDVMPWSGRGGSAYSQMEVADGRKLTTHRALFVRLPIVSKGGELRVESEEKDNSSQLSTLNSQPEFLLIWTTTPWTLTSNVAAMVNPDLEYVQLKSKRDGAVYYFAKDNLEFQRLAKEFKEGFGRPEWQWPKDAPKLKTLAQIFKEQGGYEIVDPDKPVFGRDLLGWTYQGPFDDLPQQFLERSPSARDLEAATKLRSAKIAVDIEGQDAKSLAHSIRLSRHRFIIDLATSLSMAAVPGAKSPEEQLLIVKDFLPYEAVEVFRGIIEASQAIEELSPTITEMSRNEALKLLKSLQFKGDVNERVGIDYLGRRPFQHAFQTLYNIAIDWLTGKKSGLSCHRVVDGGRDFKGTPLVVAGEGTGIVHSAPGCGDVDHVNGQEHHFVIVAPLNEDGTFMDGFGPFTGKNSVAPETVDLVIDELKKKDLLVAVEKYPHIYPFCWRTGDELVFRLVDEWFINMDWRDEIMGVTKQIQWLPDSIQGQERELEWLGNMRDWMISKKRFWGLALPIWINPNDPSDFEVMGSLAELKDRAVEGWDAFEGHTPHKPWIDAVKIKSAKTGAVLSRIPDVGNPWLDAGIVPFSTLGFNTHPDYWKRWYPADLVTECFPGQFRNWFYSMLALSTMMQYDRTDDPEEKKPFKTLLGHRLVMNEAGKPMHKSDGTAIWFEEAAEQLGVDTMRWMYLQQNPATDLRFGTRHKDQKVTLETVNGPTDKTIDGVETCKVESGPADEVRRQVLLPLWNSYSFFINYARLDGFDPKTPPVPFAERPHLDQWILTNLQDTIGKVRGGLESFNTPVACQALAKLIDDLSNWYIRRNRKRFWRSKDASDQDKLAAYQTLYTVLVTLTKLLAPLTPFLAERMYRNLVPSWDDSAPESVHLCAFPVADPAWQAKDLLAPMETAQKVVSAGHHLREAINQRVRQPLGELRVALSDHQARQQVSELSTLIADELNVKTVTILDSLGEIVKYKYRANPATLGKKYGKMLGKLKEQIPLLLGSILNPFRDGLPQRIEVDGASFELLREDISEDVEEAAGWKSAAEGDVQIALSTALTPALVREGMARDFVRHIQQLRKDANLEIEQHIRVTYSTTDAEVTATVKEWSDYIRGETLADALVAGDIADAKSVNVGEATVKLAIELS